MIAAYAGETWDKWMNAVTFGVYEPGLSTTDRATIAKKVTDLFGMTKPPRYQDEDLNYIMNKIYSSQQSIGSRKMLFCHSQGNLYCNLVYDKLMAAGASPYRVDVVGVAVPYGSLKSGNVYTTSANDVVIDAVRAAAMLTLPTLNVLGPTLQIP